MCVAFCFRCFVSDQTNFSLVDTASADDPNEISFSKGEILEIMDNAGQYTFALSILLSCYL
jgi:hypothetical protein